MGSPSGSRPGLGRCTKVGLTCAAPGLVLGRPPCWPSSPGVCPPERVEVRPTKVGSKLGHGVSAGIWRDLAQQSLSFLLKEGSLQGGVDCGLL